ncbi:MAG: nitrilase-related carbon-nitrogen hydrolase [Verrucomicrobiota bacterium]
MATLIKPTTEPLGWKKSFLWLALAVACFHAAYTSIHFPATGLMIFGYAYGLVRLTDQPNVRRAFYFGLATGFLCYAPQLFFFWRIFNVAAVVLWLVLAFWVGLFTATVCGAIRRWGKVKTAWLIPLVWTGIEYFRSELYYLKFSWLNVGYLSTFSSGLFGMYGTGFFVFGIFAVIYYWRTFKITFLETLVVIALLFIALALSLPALASSKRKISRPITFVGVQMEFPPENIIPKILDQALAKNTNASIFVLSEYTLDGGVPDSLKNWCRNHARFLVVGGKDPVGPDNYYNTAFVIGTNGEIVFKQVKSVPIQFFKDGLRAPEQKVWNSPWGKIGLCVCYDLSYTRVTDELVRQGAQLLIVPTMDVLEWGWHQHELHARVAPVRAAEYGIPIFRVTSSGISQAITGGGSAVAKTSIPGNGEIFSAQLRLPRRGSLPLDRYLAPPCAGITGIVLAVLLLLAWKECRAKNAKVAKDKSISSPS